MATVTYLASATDQAYSNSAFSDILVQQDGIPKGARATTGLTLSHSIRCIPRVLAATLACTPATEG